MSSASPKTPKLRSSKAPSDEPYLPVGTTIDQYRVIRLLGRGGMGQVYLARDIQLGRKVALKLLRSRDQGNLRFLQEARLTARFSHPHIVTVYAFGEYAGSPYLALEYLHGETLTKRIRSQSLVLSEVVRISEAITAAVAESHRHGILHLDLKPGNVIISRDGCPKVLDFGLASLMSLETPDGEAGEATGDLGAPRFAGTPVYMSPEQLRGQPKSTATDLWAIGVMMQEMVTGKRPFSEYEVDLKAFAQAAIFEAPAELSEIPVAYEQLKVMIQGCLSKRSQDRPSTDTLLEALREMLDTPRARRQVDESPFRGLLSFQTKHADAFYGRDREITEMVERLRAEPVMAVVGASGVGKSSFVQAGVIPRLMAQGRWMVLSMRPGSRPFQTLASRILVKEGPTQDEPSSSASLAAPLYSKDQIEELAAALQATPQRLSVRLEQLARDKDTQVLLLIDQLEELYTLTKDSEVQTRFMEAVALVADDQEDPIRSVFTIRDDFLSRIADAGPEVQTVLRRMMLLRVPEPAQLAETLTMPIKAVGYTFDEPELVDEMVAEVGGRPASLPLLQFAAQMLWDRRDREARVLEAGTYRDLGGVAGVLGKHGEQILETFNIREREVVRHILLRLVTPEHTRRVGLLSEVLDGLPVEAERVANRLIEARILTAGRARDGASRAETVELAHESLIASWPQLRSWLEDDQEELRFLDEIGRAADLWASRGSLVEEAWIGDALAEARRNRARCTSPIPEKVERFIQAGENHTKVRMRRRWGLIASIVGVLFVSLVVVSIQSWRTEEQRVIAEKGRATALREGATAAFAQGRVLEARAKLRTALEIDDTVLGRALWWRLDREPKLWSHVAGDLAAEIAFSPDGKTLVVPAQDGNIHLYDVATRQLNLLTAYDEVNRTYVSFSSDSRQLATVDYNGRVILWDLETLQIKLRLTAEHGVTDVHFRDGDRELIVIHTEGRIRRWRLPDGTSLDAPAPREPKIKGETVRLYGSLVVERGYRRKIRVWNIDTEEVVLSKTISSGIRVFAVRPDGRVFVTGDQSGVVRVWSVETGESIHEISASGDTPFHASFSPDGRWLLVGCIEGTIRLFRIDDPASGPTFERQMDLGTAQIISSAWRVDGRVLALGSRTRDIILLDLERAAVPVRTPGHNSAVIEVLFSHDGRYVATGGRDETVRIWNVETGAVELSRKVDGEVWGLAFSPKDEHFMWSSTSIDWISWPLRARKSPVYTGDQGKVYSLSIDPSGRYLASNFNAKQIRVYDLENNSVRHTLGGNMIPFVVTFDRDGRRVAAGDMMGIVRVWDADSGEKLAQFPGHKKGLRDAHFGPKGRYLITADGDTTVRRWDLETRTASVVGRFEGELFRTDLSKDGRFMALSSMLAQPVLWDVATGQTLQTFRGHRGAVSTVALSDDAKQVATGSNDHAVRVFDSESGRPGWRAPIMLAPATLITHTGVHDLAGNGPKTLGDHQWARALTEAAVRGVEIPSTELVCLVTYEGLLQVWDRSEDRRIRTATVAEETEIFADRSGCFTVGNGRLTQYAAKTESPRVIAQEGVTAAAMGPDGLLVVRTTTVAVLDTEGRERESHTFRGWGTAATADVDRIYLGHRSGRLQVISRDKLRQEDESVAFQNAPSAPITRILAGPPGTLIAGAQDGTVGLWSLMTGERLHFERLHGPIIHLEWVDDRLYAASELGAFLVWNLELFSVERCRLLERIWAEVPVVWEVGRPVTRAVPANHICRKEAVR